MRVLNNCRMSSRFAGRSFRITLALKKLVRTGSGGMLDLDDVELVGELEDRIGC